MPQWFFGFSPVPLLMSFDIIPTTRPPPKRCSPLPFFLDKTHPSCLFHDLQHQNQHDQNENVIPNNTAILGFFCPTTFVSYARRPCRNSPRVARNRGTSRMHITSHQVAAGKQLLRRQSWYFCTSKASKLITSTGPRETARRHHH